MKTLRLKIFQDTACYKKPFAIKVAETYPLPPYSTVKGMIHYILDTNEYIPMSISIQGNYEGIFTNYQTMRLYKANVITQMPLKVHLLFNVNLIIHIKADESIINSILAAFKSMKEYPSLGRREDLVRIDEIRIVDLKKVNIIDEGESLELKNSIYIPKEILPNKRLSGINYKLNFKYEIKDNLRVWEKINVLYVEKGSAIEDGIFYIDDTENERIPVFFNN